MSDKKKIPDWQKTADTRQTEAAAVDLTPEQTEPPESPDSTKRQDLLDQARTFLGHEEIRDATTESKISFLEEKGLTNDEIHTLLGISRNEAAVPEPAADVVQSSQTQGAAAPSLQARETAPPIITYPEFLLHASKPPPLITPTRVLKAMYGATAVGTAIYGASTFILQPMFDNLSEARHELFSTTKDQLKPLNEALAGVVSKVPAAAATSNIGHERRIPKDRDASDEEDASVTSDPTELFHRDIGVQTTPEDDLLTPSVQPTILATSEKLATLRGHLNTLLHSSSTSLIATDRAKTELKETEVYLDQLRYGSGGNGYSALSGDDGWRNQIFGNKVAGAAARKADAVESFKTDIRAMKGTLLSARNFPRGGERGR